MTQVWLQNGRVGACRAPDARLWLSDAEHARLDRITAPARRAQFLAGRWLARHLLAGVFGGNPMDWPLSAPPDGPPRPLSAPSGAPSCPHLALTHSGDHVACAVAAIPLGLDLEAPGRARNTARLAAAACTPGEIARLSLLEGTAGDRHFYCMWTLKEAWLKQRGEGLSPGRLARLHTAPAREGMPAPAQVWQARNLSLALLVNAPFSVQWQETSEQPFGGPPTRWTVTET